MSTQCINDPETAEEFGMAGFLKAAGIAAAGPAMPIGAASLDAPAVAQAAQGDGNGSQPYTIGKRKLGSHPGSSLAEIDVAHWTARACSPRGSGFLITPFPPEEAGVYSVELCPHLSLQQADVLPFRRKSKSNRYGQNHTGPTIIQPRSRQS